VKIIDEGKREIIYQKYDNLSGPILTIPRSDVIMIQHEYRTDSNLKATKNINPLSDSDKYISLQQRINYFKSNDTNSKREIIEPSDLLSLSNSELYILGQMDASMYYKNYKVASTATLITSIVNPIIGLIPSITCSVTTPADKNLNYPNLELMKKPGYYYGYTNKSEKIKRGKVWTNWAIALGVNMVASLIIYSVD